MKNKLLIYSLICIFTSCTVLASDEVKKFVMSDLNVKLSGCLDFQSGIRINQDNLEDSEKNISPEHDVFAFTGGAALVADLSNEVDGIIYGGKIVLVPTAKRKGGIKYDGSHIYIESHNWGKLELGSPFPASSQMMISGTEVAVASGGWSNYAKIDSEYLKQGKKLSPSFATKNVYFLGSSGANIKEKPYTSELARTIAYYTPKIELSSSTSIKIGASYTPDTSNTGAEKHTKKSNGITKKEIDDESYFEIYQSVKNAISVGFNVEQNLGDGIDLKFALTGEYGKPTGKAKRFKGDDLEEEFELSDLKAFNVGGALTLGSVSLSASYGSLGKSLTTEEFHKSGRESWYYSGALAYSQGSFATSIAYFKSDKFKNTLNATSLGVSYKIFPELKLYTELSMFKLEGKSEFYEDIASRKTGGTTALLGIKMSF